MTVFQRWTEFMGENPEGLHVIIDDQVGKKRGQLRSLSLLTELGLSHATYNPVWHTDLQLVPYTYHKLGSRQAASVLAEHGHLVQVVSQETIDHSAFHFTSELIRLAMKRGPSRPLVVLVCDQALTLPGSIDGKTIFEDLGLLSRGVLPVGYAALSRRYRREARSPLQQALTENLYFHRLALELAQAGWKRFGRLSDLFQLSVPEFPLTPLMRTLVEYFLMDYDRREAVEFYEGPPFIRDAMRSWLERGEAGAVANALWFGMAVYDFDMNKVLRWKEVRG